MTVKNFWGSMIFVVLCSNTVPISPQKVASKSSLRRGATTASKKTRGRASVKKVAPKRAAVETPVVSEEAAIQPVVANQPAPVAQTVVSPKLQVEAVSDDIEQRDWVSVPDSTKKQAWSEMQDAIVALQGAQFFFHPTLSPYNGDPIFDEDLVSSASKSVFRLSIAANESAVVTLRGDKDLTITIGADNNKYFIVRIGGLDAQPIMVPVKQGMTILEGDTKYASFWISYDKANGKLQIGKGSIGANILMTWIDPAPFKSNTVKLGLGGWADPAGSIVLYTNVYVVSPEGRFYLASSLIKNVN